MAGRSFVVRGVLRSMSAGTWTRLDLSVASSALLGSRNKVRVRGWVAGRPFETVAIPNGDGTHSILFTKPVLAATGTRSGETVEARIEPLAGPRPVRLPAELRAALSLHPAIARTFGALAPSHRRAWAQYVAEAKQVETRRRRAGRAMERIGRGERDPQG